MAHVVGRRDWTLEGIESHAHVRATDLWVDQRWVCSGQKVSERVFHLDLDASSKDSKDKER
jgi:hypothetical protein